MVIDPIYLGLLAGMDASKAANLFAMGPILSDLSQACLTAGCTPILAHHTTQHLPTVDKAGNYKPIDRPRLGRRGRRDLPLL